MKNRVFAGLLAMVLFFSLAPDVVFAEELGEPPQILEDEFCEAEIFETEILLVCEDYIEPASSNIVWQMEINAATANALNAWRVPPYVVARAGGEPPAPAFSHAGGVLSVTGRGANWHGFDVLLEYLDLSDDGRYRITVDGTGTDLLRLEFPADGNAGSAWSFGGVNGTETRVSTDFTMEVPPDIVPDIHGLMVRVRTNGTADFSVSRVVIERVADVWRPLTLNALIAGNVPGISQGTQNLIAGLVASHGGINYSHGWFDWDGQWTSSGIRAALFDEIGIEIVAWEHGRAVTWSRSYYFLFEPREHPQNSGEFDGFLATHFRTTRDIIPGSGHDMMRRLGPGINIGNTLEARLWGPLKPDVYVRIPGTQDYKRVPQHDPESWNWFSTQGQYQQEFMWGATVLEEWHFQAIAARGFNSVRIPVTWETQLVGNGPVHERDIRPEWMARVREVVQWAYDTGMYVILNTHHERSQADSLKVIIHRKGAEAAKPWLRNIWGQIIAEFAEDFGQRLIFEPMNEPYRAYPGHPDGSDWIQPGDPAYLWEAISREVNTLNRYMVAFIRNHNNDPLENRVIVTAVPQADPAALQFYEHPNDDYIILGTFFYPGHFCEDENLRLPGHLISDIEAAVHRGIPIFIKETAPIAMERQPHRYLMSEWEEWVPETFEALAGLGVPSMWWNFCDAEYSLFNLGTNTWSKDGALVNAFFEASAPA